MPSLNEFLSWCAERANNPNVGYSQYYREGQQVSYAEAQRSGRNYIYDFENYAGTDAIITYYDCSSFVGIGLSNVGFQSAYSSVSTVDLAKMLRNCGFKDLENGNDLQPGDIAMYRVGDAINGHGHTLVVYEKGSKYDCTFVGANGRNGDDIYTIPKALPNQVSFSVGYDAFDQFFRYYDWDDSEPVITPSNDPVSKTLLCAILGNWCWESSLNPNCWENGVPKSWQYIWDGYGGYGLKGWTNIYYNGQYVMNLEKLHNWLSDHNYGSDSGDGMCEYEYGDGHEYNYSSALADADKISAHSWDEWCNNWQGYSDNLEQMTYDYFRCCEGINDSTFSDRYRYAQWFYDNIENYINDDSITDWYLGNNYLIGSIDTGDTAHIINNAVMIWRRFQRLNGSSVSAGGTNWPYTDEVQGHIGNTGVQTNEEKELNLSLEDFKMAAMGKSGNNGIDRYIRIKSAPRGMK